MPDSNPLLICRDFHLAKDGCSPEEYEDAFACIPSKGRFAIADGASESSFAGNWARLLAQGAVNKRGPWRHWLPDARSRWLRSFQVEELPWYAEEKAAQGAHATLLTLTFRPELWTARAVGDACLFAVRNDRLRRAFPLTRSEHFDTTPSLICSRPGLVRPKRLTMRGEWNAGDRYFLMTDALAQWFLKEWENRRKPWREIANLQSESEFASWLNALRRSRELRNDDVTLLAIQIQAP